MRRPLMSFALVALAMGHLPVASAEDSRPPGDSAKLDNPAPGGLTACQGFSAFEKTVFKEPIPGGAYIVDGDVPIHGRRALRRFYERFCPPPDDAFKAASLVVDIDDNNRDISWPRDQKNKLTYCVSTQFGTRHQQVVDAMKAATKDWMNAADVRFQYLPGENERCDASNDKVLFDVNPINVGRYLARAFFPNNQRAERTVLIDDASFDEPPLYAKLTLTGILRHELGHVLGFRHEHIRPEASAGSDCSEERMDKFRPLTSHDPYSVMHYPHCKGLGDWSFQLTEQDIRGAVALYGPSRLASNQGKPVSAQGTRKNSTTRLSFANPGLYEVTSFTAAPHSSLRAKILAGGDADLLLELGSRGKQVGFDCVANSDSEECAKDIPAGRSNGKLYIQAYEPGEFELLLDYVPVPKK